MELQCSGVQRRAVARAAGRNGIDSVTVSADQRTLTVTLFGAAPDDLTPASFRLNGPGRPVRVVRVTDCPDVDPDRMDCLSLTVDRPGDRSTYRLSVVGRDVHGRPATAPHPDFDPRCAWVEFSFAQNCVGLLDCAPQPCPPQADPPGPVIDYRAKDYPSFRDAMLERLSLTLPGWTERHAADLGITLVELLAYAGDQLSYRQDAVATEAYLDTARLRVSVRRHVRLVDYPMHDGCAARAVVCLDATRTGILPSGDFWFAAGTQVFTPLVAEDVPVRAAHNRISLWTWGDEECCLPTGATTATLRDNGLTLSAGDVLVFEEIVGAVTGEKADADPTHRQAVRLTAVRSAVDQLFRQAVLEVTWATVDALRFPLCVSARGGADCRLLEVGVAVGNAVIVEHGSTDDQPATLAPSAPGQHVCSDPCWGCPEPGGTIVAARRPRPTVTIADGPITRTVTFPEQAHVARAQADRLRGVADRARAALRAMLADGPDAAYLRMLFGSGTLRRVDLARHPRAALLTLLDRFDEFLAVKLDRVAELAARADAGYVLAAHGEGWEIGQAWGRAEGTGLDPGRAVFRGPISPALAPDPRAALPAVQVVVDGDAGGPWLPRSDLLGSGPTDRDVVGEVDDDDLTTLRFGDGHAGEAPAAGATLRISYRVGNGAAGNVGAEAIDQVLFRTTAGAPVKGVRNPLAATGGVDPEPVADVRALAPGYARRQLLRAITADDYATLAETVPGVQRAAADLRWTGSWYEARVAVDALGADVAPAGLLATERPALHRYRRIGHDLVVASATMIPLRITLCVLAEPGRIAAHIRAAVLTALGAGPGGLFAPDALTFGSSVRVSRIVAVVLALPGVRAAQVTVLERLFDGPGDALDTSVLALGPDEIAQLDNDPTHPEHGVLEVTVRGGR